MDHPDQPTQLTVEHVTAAPAGVEVCRVTFPGARFDGVAVRELFELSNRLPTPHPRLLVDTAGVALVPSGGMGMLLTIRKRFLAVGGQLHVVLPDEDIRRAFAVANLNRMLKLFETTDEALAAFKK